MWETTIPDISARMEMNSKFLRAEQYAYYYPWIISFAQTL